MSVSSNLASVDARAINISGQGRRVADTHTGASERQTVSAEVAGRENCSTTTDANSSCSLSPALQANLPWNARSETMHEYAKCMNE